MATSPESPVRPSSDEAHVENFNLDTSTARAVYSLIDAVDSESIADEFDIGTFSKTHDFDNHVKIAVLEGIDPSNSLAELEETTQTDAVMDEMAASTCSRYTNDRDYRAVVRLVFDTTVGASELPHVRAYSSICQMYKLRFSFSKRLNGLTPLFENNPPELLVHDSILE